MDIVTLSTFAIALLIAAASPGPGMTAIVARALGGGFRSAMWMVLGLVVGDIVYLSFTVLGLAAIAQRFGMLFLVIKYAGAAYLLWLAWKLWTSRGDVMNVEARAADSPVRTTIAGLLVTLGNPKTMVFYLALVPTLLPLDQVTPLAFAELVVIVTILLLAVGAAYAAAAAGAREMFRSKVALRRLNRVAGVAMAGAAAAVVAR